MADLENVHSSDLAVNQLQDAVASMKQQLQDATTTAQTTADGKTDDSYTAGTPGNWAAPPPTTITEALDRIATAVAAGLVGPIA